MSKLLLLTLNEQEEKVIDKIISAIADYIQFEPTQIAPASVLSFPGLEIRQFQRRVIQDGKEVNLTRLECPSHRVTSATIFSGCFER